MRPDKPMNTVSDSPKSAEDEQRLLEAINRAATARSLSGGGQDERYPYAPGLQVRTASANAEAHRSPCEPINFLLKGDGGAERLAWVSM